MPPSLAMAVNGIAHDALDIDLAHQVVDHGGAAGVHQVEDGLDLVFGAGRAAFQGVDLGDGLAFVGGVRSEARHGGEGVIRLAHFDQVLLHLERDLAARGGVGEPFLDLAVGQRPAGQAYAEIGAGAIVGVLVGDHVHAFAAEFLDQRERLIAGAPDAAAVDLEVRDLHRHAGFLADVHGFGDGFDFVDAFVAHVAGVDAAVGRGGLGQRDHFGGIGVDAGHVFESGGEAHRAFAHGAIDQRLHLADFVRRGQTVDRAHHLAPHGVVADQRGDVEPEAEFGELVEPGGEIQFASRRSCR